MELSGQQEVSMQKTADRLALKFGAPITVMLTASSDDGRSYCCIHLEEKELAYTAAPGPALALFKAEMQASDT